VHLGGATSRQYVVAVSYAVARYAVVVRRRGVIT
jgi:hypothetical protein